MQQEVKKAYRRLVKEAHPDKNKAPDAQDKFVQITRAYELLSDPERRRNYDNHGVTEDTPNFNKKHDYSQYNRFGDPFDHLRDLFGDNFNNSSKVAIGRTSSTSNLSPTRLTQIVWFPTATSS